MPDRDVRTLQDLVRYQYAKITARRALGPDAKWDHYGFVKQTLRDLQRGKKQWSDIARKDWQLVEDYDLLAVVSLPAAVFKPYAGVKTGVLLFRRPAETTKHTKDTKEQHKVWFYEIRADGFDPDKVSGGGRPETPERNDIPDLLRQWKEYKNSRFANPPGVEAGKLLPPGTEKTRCWWATIEFVVENDYNLTAGRYKPQIAEKPPEEDPVQLIRETLSIERKITEGLERLLKEVEQ